MACILIIDDDAEDRKVLRKMLEDAGYHILEASDGEAGLELYRNEPAELVITDIHMPKKDGLEVIKELRQDYPNSKIIAVSGGSTVNGFGYLNIAQSLGANRVFYKPIDLKKMLEAVKELCGEN